MLRSMNDLEGYAISATDGVIGHVKDCYFDDHAWVIRYLVVDTGTWLASRKVLISPVAIGQPDWAGRVLPVAITREQVKNSPDIDTDKPVSRQHEMQYLGYYGYPYYWGGTGLWGAGILPGMMITGNIGYDGKPYVNQVEMEKTYQRAEEARHRNDDPRLRSCKEVVGYHIRAADGEIGHVQGMLVDEDTWAIRYFVVDTSNWWLGHQVLISPQWIGKVSWLDTTVTVNLTRQAVRDSPDYDHALLVDRNQETEIYRHYGHPGYWDAQVKDDAAI